MRSAAIAAVLSAGVVSLAVAAPLAPLRLAWPTGVEVEPSGKLLVVENGAGRLDRIDPKSGTRSVVASIARPYAVARSSGGAVFVSAADGVWRVGAGAPQRVAEA